MNYFLITLLIIFILFITYPKKTKSKLNINQTNQIKSGCLIDVRTKKEFKQGHLPKSKNIEASELISNSSNYLNKEDEYYLYCLSGMRANNAVLKLKKQGYKVSNLGGIKSYSGQIKK